jgi:DNA-binding transcriptional regulator YiaG
MSVNSWRACTSGCTLVQAMDEASAVKVVHRLQTTGLLAHRRQTLGLSQRQIGDAVKVSQPTVSDWEAAKSKPRGRHAVALLEVLEIEP